MMHRLFTLAAIGLAALTAVAEPFDLDARQAPSPTTTSDPTTPTCATGAHLMIAGGCRIPCASNVPGLLSTLIGNITSLVPGSDTYYVPYNGSQQQAIVSGPIMIEAAYNYSVSCPNTPIVFLGYSLGGVLVMNTLCGGLSTNLTNQVVSSVVYGEETFVANQSYNKASCTNNAPQYPRNNTNECAPYASTIQSYCFNTDPNCCTNGTLPLAHFVYPGYFDTSAASSVATVVSAWRATHIPVVSTSSTSSSSTTTPTATFTTTTRTSTTVITKTVCVRSSNGSCVKSATRTNSRTVTRTVTIKVKPTKSAKAP